jgi:hypothetical protein
LAGDSSATPANAESPRGLEHLAIEDVYCETWGGIGGAGRLRRTFSLSAEFWDMIEFQIRKDLPGISVHEARRRTAKRVYLIDDPVQRRLDQPEDREKSGLITRKPSETGERLDRLSTAYLIHQRAAFDAIKNNALFQAIDEQSFVTLDFPVGEKIPGELGWSKHREVVPGVMAPVLRVDSEAANELRNPSSTLPDGQAGDEADRTMQ